MVMDVQSKKAVSNHDLPETLHNIILYFSYVTKPCLRVYLTKVTITKLMRGCSGLMVWITKVQK